MAGTSRLGDRLRLLRETKAAPREPAPSAPEHTRRVLSLPGWERIGEYTYRRQTDPRATVEIPAADPLLVPAGTPVEDLVFYDTETTGLSSGAGSVAFLVGIGTVKAGRLTVEQLFLADFPGEPEFVGALSERLTPEKLYVSYNGKSFDRHMLSTRFLINGLHLHLDRQLDLLYAVRAVYGGVLDSCTLGAVEEHVLAVPREDDIPGAEIPDVYFRYLEDGDPTDLERVFQHNLQDIVSLATLLSRIEHLGVEPAGPVDLCGLGRFLLARRHPRAEDMLRRAHEQGSFRAGKLLSSHYKRVGRLDEAARLWRSMCRGSAVFPYVELAKYFEHRIRDYQTALEVVNERLSSPLPLPGILREELLHRKRRLERRCNGSVQAG